MSKQPKIVIIGAGVAGLGAADILVRNGFNDITVLEAKDRIGGRIFTLPYGRNERYIVFNFNFDFHLNSIIIYIICFTIALYDVHLY